MSGNYIIRKRRNKILDAEILIAAVIISFLSINNYNLHPAIAVLIGIGAAASLIFLFFHNRIFRYSFAILFSFIWGWAAFLIGQSIEKASDTTAWVMAIIGFGFSLLAHKDHFAFIKGARRYEYEVQ